MAKRKQSSKLPHIDDATLKKILARLTAMRAESQAFVNLQVHKDLRMRGETLDVGDDLDQASTARDREFNLLMHERHLRRLKQIDEALERVEEGSYGICEGTEEPINPKRLLLMPLARYSLEYQQQQEKLLGRTLEEGMLFDEEQFGTEE
ncbi:MAG: TraR/DksA C4-type zinc finger protein [Candidatus Lambdaproteobacteria bacterium]|nr:TraR/DksA C4-type zinc finger protein [Candidatus Lambdaproteobacteria bacterium]